MSNPLFRHTGDEAFTAYQSDVDDSLNKINANPLMGGSVVEDVAVSTSPTSIGGGRGAIPITNPDGVTVIVTNTSGEVSVSVSAGSSTMSFWVF